MRSKIRVLTIGPYSANKRRCGYGTVREIKGNIRSISQRSKLLLLDCRRNVWIVQSGSTKWKWNDVAKGEEVNVKERVTSKGQKGGFYHKALFFR